MDLKKIINTAVRDSLDRTRPHKNKIEPKKEMKENTVKKVFTSAKSVIKEAMVAIPQSFILSTEKLSQTTKVNHEKIYKAHVDTFNKVSSGLDGANKYEAKKSYSAYRSLKMDENYNLNSIKLHELYFSNISDLASEISVDSIPYMKLSRDFGTFENWQFDFMASCKSSRNGWGVLVYEPYKNVYMNIVVNSNNSGIPVGAIPVLVMDMFEHAYENDYETNVDDYIVSMMREINWNVVEARMVLAEKSELGALYMIKPVYNYKPKEMLAAVGQAPIEQVKSAGGADVPATVYPGAGGGDVV